LSGRWRAERELCVEHGEGGAQGGEIRRKGRLAGGKPRRLKAAINPGISRQAFPGTAPEKQNFSRREYTDGPKSFQTTKMCLRMGIEWRDCFLADDLPVSVFPPGNFSFSAAIPGNA